MKMLLILFLVVAIALGEAVPDSTPPHIVFALIDDLGWHDVGHHNAELHTPHMNALLLEGIELDRHYAYRFCSPTRSSLMSGRYPMHVNQWNHVGSTMGGGVGANFTIIAKKLKSAGYSTHQGQSSPDLLPAGRGFDTSLGYLNGAEDHFNQHRVACGNDNFVDLYETDHPAKGKNGTYGALIYHDEALRLIEEHDPATPFFLYLAFQINHAPLQVPDKYKAYYPCDNSNCTTRQTYQAMTVLADEVLGNVTNALRAKDMWDNTLVVVSSDNGGPTGTDANSANNFPLRGGKYSDFEGGVRVAAFVTGGLVPQERRGIKLEGADSFVHISDWYTTFCGLAGVDATDDGAVDTAGRSLPSVDGLDQWPFLSGAASSSPRTVIPFTMGQHQPGNGGAIISGEYKLIFGLQSPAFWNGPEYPNGTTPAPISVTCGDIGCLYNIIDDPTEHHDLASDPAYSATLANLTTLFHKYADGSYQTPWIDNAMNCTGDARVAEMLEGGFWTPWTDKHA